jgi:hypothetical protein
MGFLQCYTPVCNDINSLKLVVRVPGPASKLATCLPVLVFSARFTFMLCLHQQGICPPTSAMSFMLACTTSGLVWLQQGALFKFDAGRPTDSRFLWFEHPSVSHCSACMTYSWLISRSFDVKYLFFVLFFLPACLSCNYRGVCNFHLLSHQLSRR